MKKIIILTLLGFLSISIVKAQNTFNQEFFVGASFGTNFSSVSFAPKVKTKQLMGYMGGAIVRWNTENHIGLQAELNYSQNGWDEDFSESSNPNYKYSRTINYLELPFLTHIFFGGKKARFFINLGPKIGYMLSESTSQNINGAEISDRVTEQHNMAVEKKFAWGLCGGPGFELRTGIGLFSLEGRYSYALGDIYGSRKEDYFPKSSSQVLSVKLSYMIPLF
ncbi:porin family protein [Massilibacteroides sp.]|uniref:porin family protein n=1 Tax=Massilibacteroides sp. TaxID=2034766 RepID=UPI0026238287|nr:porin family protein [Massilibacteroides sp.]MDD4515092.1 porin family protein [Massilibacteroides sp.]